MLSIEQIKTLIVHHSMISNYLDLEKQLQPNGFDLTVELVGILRGRASVIGFGHKELPDQISEPLVGDKFLDPGYYLLTMCEEIRLPKNIAAVPMNRTSLFRMGAFIAGGWYDRGYCGKPQTGLMVTRPLLLLPRARILQLGFFNVENVDDAGYNGEYQNK